MAQLGGGKINPHPCTPEDAIANWTIQDQINESFQQYVGLDSFKMKVSGTDATEGFLSDKLPPSEAYDPNADGLVLTEITYPGGGVENMQMFLNSSGVAGYNASGTYAYCLVDGVLQWYDTTAFASSGTDDKTVRVNSAGDTAEYLLPSMYFQASYETGEDLPVYADYTTSAGNEKLVVFIQADQITGHSHLTPILLGKDDNAWKFFRASDFVSGDTLIYGVVKGNVAYGTTDIIVDNVVALAGGDDPSEGNPATEITVTRTQQEAFPDNTPIMAIFDGATWATLCVERNRLVRGQVVGTVSGGDPTFQIDNLATLASGIDPRTDPTDAAETVTVDNTFSENYTDNQWLNCAYNSSSRTWQPLSSSSTTEINVLYGKSTSEITAATGWDSDGWGSGTWQRLDTDGSFLGDETTVYNRYFDTIPSDTPVWVIGSYVLNAGCSAGPAV